MLRFRGLGPFDYALCTMTVTVYHREGLTRQVLEGVHFEWTDGQDTSGGVRSAYKNFLLVVPGGCDMAPGDKVVPGIGPELESWSALSACVAKTVKPRYFQGRLCHTEVRG